MPNLLFTAGLVTLYSCISNFFFIGTFSQIKYLRISPSLDK